MSSRASKDTGVLLVILSCQAMVVIDSSIVNVALPHIQRSMHFTTTGLSWIVNAYTLTFGGLLLLGARAGDLLGRRRMFIAGLVVFTVGSIAGGCALWRPMLLASRAVQGLGGAIAAPAALALLTDRFPEGRSRTRALSYFAAVSLAGSALGQVLGGALTEWTSWRLVLFINVPVATAAITGGRRVLRETPRQKGRLDLPGGILSVLGMGLLAYGFVSAPTAGWISPRTLTSFGLGALCSVAFVGVERRAVSPIVPLHLFADRTRSGANAGRGLLLAGTTGSFFFLSQYLQEVLGYSPIRSGLSFLPLTIALFSVSQLCSRIAVGRVSSKLLMCVGTTISAVGILMFARLSLHAGYVEVVLSLVLVGVGNGVVVVPLTSAALAGVGPSEAGAASGVLNAMQQVGGLLGVAVLVSVFGVSGEHLARTAFVDHVDRAFFGGAMFLVAALAVLVVVVRRDRPAARLKPVSDVVATT